MSKRPENPYKGHPVLGARPTRPLTLDEFQQHMFALCEFHGIPAPDSDPLAFSKLACCLAAAHVPAFQARKRGGRPLNHSPRDIMWAYIEFARVRDETGLPSTEAIIEKMAEDQFWRNPDIALGETKKEVLEKLRYMLTDRITQPEIASLVSKELHDFVSQIGELMVSKRN